MNKSYLIAAALALIIVVWMAAGHVMNSSESGNTATANSANTTQVARMSVATTTQQVRDVTRHIVAEGQVEPNRVVTVRAETTGRIAAVLKTEGDAVTASDRLVTIQLKDRPARLQKAQALVAEKQENYASAQKLGAQGFLTPQQINEVVSNLRSAEAELQAIELDIAATTVRAPFEGILERRQVELGDYVQINSEIATVVDLDPVIVAVQVAQQDIGQIGLGDQVGVTVATGQQATGEVRFIAPRAEAATRTFRVEIEVANPDRSIRAGISAEARIPTGRVAAHFVSPAVLTLDDTGEVGVKTVNDNDAVEFYPVEIELAEAGGVWVSGLPAAARIITVGQGFVRDGEIVRSTPATADAAGQNTSSMTLAAPNAITSR